MSKIKLNAIVTKALLDKSFRADILNGHRSERITEFNLSDEEALIVLSIEAKTLDQFVEQLGSRLYSAETRQ